MKKFIHDFIEKNSEFDAYVLMIKTPIGLLGIAGGSVLDIAALSLTAHARASAMVLGNDEETFMNMPDRSTLSH